jgi:hypothetical protein
MEPVRSHANTSSLRAFRVDIAMRKIFIVRSANEKRLEQVAIYLHRINEKFC